ncbi:MAG TPA: hypothetical protein PLQ76_01495 [bacterium]|nr:hypothetical protein [bacterium]
MHRAQGENIKGASTPTSGEDPARNQRLKTPPKAPHLSINISGPKITASVYPIAPDKKTPIVIEKQAKANPTREDVLNKLDLIENLARLNLTDPDDVLNLIRNIRLDFRQNR